MKKQLTVFAAAALIASFATAALAATPTVTMSGKFDYNVSYTITDQKWTDDADSKLLGDPHRLLQFTVATTGDPNIGSVTFGFDNGVYGDNPDITLTGGFYGGTLKLGAVAANWDAITGGTGGAGAEYLKSFDAVSLDVVTASKTTGAAEAAKVTVGLSDTNTIYGGFAANPDWEGVGFVGGKFVVGPATIEGKFATELKDDKGTGLWATASLQATESLKLTGTFVQAESDYNGATFGDFGAIAINDNEFANIGWAAANASRADGTNIKVQADLVAIKDVASPYLIYKTYADDTWAFIGGTNFAPLCLTKAEVTMKNDESTTVTAEFGKTIGGITLNAYAGYKINGDDSTDTYGYVKAAKTFGWLSAWASVGVHAFDVLPAVEPTAAKVGANANFTF